MGKELPRGCEICLKGAKLVLFVTGECDRSCFYCPLSEKRRGLDVVYADEVLVESDLDVILEGKAIDAEGSGVTGGDPLLRLGRTLQYIKLLKGAFGRGHHIHLYTNGRHASEGTLVKLKAAGLDEIRFHPTKENWGKIALAKKLGMYAGAEIPAVPGDEEAAKEFIKFLVKAKADFLNINQLEFCPQNALQLKQKGLTLDGRTMAAVLGSEEAALSLVRWAHGAGVEMPVHYCSSAVKDAVQTKRRLIRRAMNVSRPYEEALEDGLLGKFVVRLESENPRAAKCKVIKALGIEPHMVGISPSGGAIEVPKALIKRVMAIFPGASAAYVQEYPTYGRESFAEYPF